MGRRPLGVKGRGGRLRCPRRSLETRFKSALGRTIRQEVQRVQMERARSLLAETNLDMPQVAKACGFGNPAWFAAAFRKEHGAPPTWFRRQFRQGEGRP